MRATKTLTLVVGLGLAPIAGFASGQSVVTFAGANGFSGPRGIAVDPAGNVYVADTGNHVIRKISADGATVSILAGSLGVSGSADSTTSGAAARFALPWGMAIRGNKIFVADSGNHTIRTIAFAGFPVATAGGTAGVGGSTPDKYSTPRGIAVNAAGAYFVADTGNCLIRSSIANSDPFAGVANDCGTADGTGTTARFNFPGGLVLDGSGNIFVADTANHTIRKITSSGVVTTVAGLPGSHGANMGASYGTPFPGGDARFYNPSGVALDISGNLYVADTGNHMILRINPDGTVCAVAGSAGQSGKADGTGQAVRLNSPSAVAVDLVQNILYVADTGNNAIRKAVLAPVITQQPKDVGFVAGGTANFSVMATGSGLAYQWHKTGSADPLSSNGRIKGSTTSSLTITSMTQSDTGSYWVSVFNSGGLVDSQMAGLHFITAYQGDGIKLRDNAPGFPYPSIVTVTGKSGPVRKVVVAINGFSHTYLADIALLLVGPRGEKCLLMSRAGFTRGLDNASLVFDADVSDRILCSGLNLPVPAVRNAKYTFRPAVYSESTEAYAPPIEIETRSVLRSTAPPPPYRSDLSVFKGTNPNGVWSLYAIDNWGMDQGGLIGSWTLQLFLDGP